LVAAFGLVGCVDEHTPARPSSSTAPADAGGAPNQATLPAPEALALVVSTLGDTSVPGEQKVGLVQYATADDESTLVKFGQALKDSNYVPLTVTAADLKWSTTPGNVTASVTIASPSPGVNPFTYPMEFSPAHGAWQLTQKSADQLLPLGGA
jgi:hypothetical protein